MSLFIDYAKKCWSKLPARVKDCLRPLMERVTGRDLDAPSRLKIGSCDGFEIAFREGTADEQVLVDSFSKDLFLAACPEYSPADGHTVIDAGAHIGAFAVLMSSLIGSGRVHAIEPNSDSFYLLRINAALNASANIISHHAALGDKDGSLLLFHGRRNYAHSTVARLSGKTERVASYSLESFFMRQGIRECHLMKLNCEGAEFPVLLGAPTSVLRCVHHFVILYHCDLWKAHREQDLLDRLESCGFDVSIIKQTALRGCIVAKNREPAILNVAEYL